MIFWNKSECVRGMNVFVFVFSLGGDSQEFRENIEKENIFIIIFSTI